MSLRRLGLCLALLLSLTPAVVSAQPAVITTLAGGGPADGSPALSAAFFWPMRVAMVPGTSDFHVSVIESSRVYRVSASKDGNDRLIGSRSVPALEATQTSTAAATVTVPSNMTLGAYYLIACADNAGNVTEIDETNNCLASDTTVQVTAP